MANSQNDHDALALDVNEFAIKYGLEHKLDVLQKAALLLQPDKLPVDVPGITKDETSALQTEKQQPWRQPFWMYLCIVVNALGAIGQGWAQSSINGANLHYPKLFDIGSNSVHDTLAVGFINSGIYLSNSLLGSWLVAPINDRFGRRGAVFVGGLISLVFNLADSQTTSWVQLLLCRLALGVGLGIVSSSLNIFAAECAPAAIRGGLGVAWQAFTAFGIFLGFLANMIVDSNSGSFGSLRWRIMLAAPAISNVLLLSLVFSCPESPSWHVKKAESYDRAFIALSYLRNSEIQAAREVLTFYFQRGDMMLKSKSLSRMLPELFTIPRVRRATLASWTTMLAQQICGINIIAFYSSTIFVEAHFSTYSAELASTIFGLVNFLGALPAVWAMDAFGRRSLLLLTLPPMAVCMAVAGFSFSISEESAQFRFGMITSMIYLFCLLYSPGMGPVPAAYSAEVFPLSHRELGASSAMAVTNLFASLLSLTFPWLLSALGSVASFLLYAALNLVAWVLIFLFVPETKQRSLEELDKVFSVPTRQFVRAHVQELISSTVPRTGTKVRRRSTLEHSQRTGLLEHGVE